MKKLAALLISLMFYTGCAQQERTKVINDPVAKGYVLGSVTYTGSPSEYAIFYRKLPDGKISRFKTGAGIMLIPIPPKGDFKQYGVSGNLFFAELPAGEYEVFSWQVFSGPAIVKPVLDFDMKFTITPDKAVYIGDYHFTQTARLGLTVTGAKVKLTSNEDRDFAVFKEKNPQISNVTINSSIPKDTNIENLGGSSKTKLTMVLPMY